MVLGPRKEVSEMKETYKVLGSMLALREFTAKDLEDYSGVTNGTIHTILTRRRELLEEIGVRETGRRGGQLKVYRLRGDRAQALEEEIGALIKQIRPAAVGREEERSGPVEGGAVSELPVSLLAGEETLLALFPNAETPDEKRALLSTATSDLESGRYEVDVLSHTPLGAGTGEDSRALIERVQALKDLAEAELTAVSGRFNVAANLRSVFDHLLEAMQYSSARGDEARADLLKERILNSPLFERVFEEPSSVITLVDGHHRVAALKEGLGAVEVAASALELAASPALAEGAGQISAKHQIAVLPSSIGGPGEEYLQHGVTSGIARSLSLLPDLAVKSPGRHSLSGHRNEAVEAVQALGERVGVRTVLSSLVEAAGNGFRCLVRLFDTGTGEVWEKQYNEPSYINISKVGTEVSKVVAGLFHIPVSSELEELLVTPATNDPEAQRLYMEARYHWNRWTPQGFTRATQCYEKALNKDPAFSLAHAGQADCYNVLTDYTSKSPRSAFKRAREAACVALVYDTALAEAYASLAYALTRYYWDWPKAEAEFLRALTINPSYTLGHQWFAEFLTARRRFDEAIARMKVAQDLEPDSLNMDAALGATYFFARQYESALSQFERVLRRDSKHSRARFSLGIVNTVTGNYDEALRHLTKAVKVSPNSTRGVAALGYALALSGQRGKAREVLDGLLQKSGHQFISRYSLAPIHIALGEKDAALSSLEEAVEQRDPLLMHLNVDPRLDEIREASRFRAVAAGVGLGT